MELSEVGKQLEVKKYELILCKPDKNRTQIAVLNEATNIVYTPTLGKPSQLEFKIPYMINENGKSKKNTNWDLIKGEMLILLNNEQYFIINVANDTGGNKDSKSCVCFSQEYELINKTIRQYVKRVKLYDSLSPVNGALNYIFSLFPSWSIGEVDAELLTLYRDIDVSSKTTLEFAYDIQEAFQCIFLFDTLNKKINVKKIENVGLDKGLYISTQNYLKTIGQEIVHDDIVTKLDIYDKDNNYIYSLEDYSFYCNHTYMSSELQSAVNSYMSALNTKGVEYLGYLQDLKTLNYSLVVKTNELNELQLEQKELQNQIDDKIKQSLDYSNFYTALQNKNNLIASKQAEINSIDSQIASKNTNISNLKQSIFMSNYFTAEQLKEMDSFIKQREFVSKNETELSDIYIEAKETFSKLNYSRVNFSIDIVDLFKIVDASQDWDKIALGDYVHVEYGKFGLNDVIIRLTGYTHDWQGNKLTLQFSTVSTYRDLHSSNQDMLNSIYKNAVSANATINSNKNKWNDAEDNAVRRIINNSLDASKANILAGKNQGVVIDEHGVWLSEKEYGVPKPEQLRLINNTIAFTKNNWQTASLAITPSGVVADSVYGRLLVGENLDIVNSSGSFSVNSEGVNITKLALNMTSADGNKKILVDPSVGIKLQIKDGVNWKDGFYFDDTGKLAIEELRANKIKIKNGTDTLIDAETKTIDFTKFNTIVGKLTASNIDVDNLTVKKALTLDANATISWSQVDGKPTIIDSNTVTTISRNEISTATIRANQISAGTVSGVIVENSSGLVKSRLDTFGLGLMNKNLSGTAQIEKLRLTTNWDYDNEGTIIFTNNNNQQATIALNTSTLNINSPLPVRINGSSVSLEGHAHTGYSLVGHNHDSNYALISHSHSGYLSGSGGNITVTTNGLYVVDSNGQGHNIFWN